MISLFQEYKKTPTFQKLKFINDSSSTISYINQVKHDTTLKSQIFKRRINQSNYTSINGSISQRRNHTSTMSEIPRNKCISIISNNIDIKDNERLMKRCYKLESSKLNNKPQNMKASFNRKTFIPKLDLSKRHSTTHSLNTKRVIKEKKEFFDLKDLLKRKSIVNQNKPNKYNNISINFHLLNKSLTNRKSKINYSDHIRKAILIIHLNPLQTKK